MSKPHNKKRNVGIIYEQLINYTSQSLIEGRKDDAENAMSIIKRNFKKGSELYKEFRLFNAMVKTSVPTSALATRILQEAKKAAQDHDEKKLRSEKSLLIREINHTLPEGSSLYSRKIQDYRTYATIQTLLNDWRSKASEDFARTTLYETKIHDWLLLEKQEANLESEKTDDINKLTVKIMTEKFNDRYGNSLSKEQKDILSEYAFSSNTNNHVSLTQKLSSVQGKTRKNINKFSKNCSNKILNEKITGVKTMVESLDSKEINDDSISKFLLLSRLNSELEEKENV